MKSSNDANDDSVDSMVFSYCFQTVMLPVVKCSCWPCKISTALARASSALFAWTTRVWFRRMPLGATNWNGTLKCDIWFSGSGGIATFLIWRFR